ncbi:Acg family FMN-binding oxidoreductase [Streptomyces meridianus]|uniref:Nitroreductase n=1 Tax=Streptomyces meridianus TaxID=2938945 RepID=A0ABT0X6K1_9ACTN|nr:nitroreductase [Streptomyces meridianus]MCM2577414.1 nitroreductase [Streptomyces meridianus]
MPQRPLDDRTVSDLVAAAVAAPSMHNAQPWRFRYARGSRTFQLRADLDRTIPHADPEGRALHLGCAAALLNLRVALADHGWAADTVLFPDAGDPALLALVRVVPAARPGVLATLYPAIGLRHTSRNPFEERRIPRDVETALRETARQEGVRLDFATGPHLQAVLAATTDAEAYDYMDAERDEDLAHWTRPGGETGHRASDGVPQDAFGPRMRGGRAPVRDFAGRRTVPGRPAADFETSPHLVLLSTERDGPPDWMAAGQAMERVLLLATLDGLSTSFATQAVEWPDLRWMLREPVTGTGHVQVVLRLGYGPPGTPTPRRPVSEVLDISGTA